MTSSHVKVIGVIKVTRAKTGYSSVSKYAHSLVVRLRLAYKRQLCCWCCRRNSM